MNRLLIFVMAVFFRSSLMTGNDSDVNVIDIRLLCDGIFRLPMINDFE